MAEPRYGEERKQMGSIVGDRPKISVIMGVYNGADRVDEAIASIRVQTFTDWEFIICDDSALAAAPQCCESLFVTSRTVEISRILILLFIGRF